MKIMKGFYNPNKILHYQALDSPDVAQAGRKGPARPRVTPWRLRVTPGASAEFLVCAKEIDVGNEDAKSYS